MKEQLITFETAKLAKEKGFQVPLDLKSNWYTRTGKLNSYTPKEPYYACTQSLLQKWLREQSSLHIAINVGLPHNCPIMYYSNVIKFGMHHKSKFKSKFFSTYEEALEEGLQEALKLI
jgi:hypothetical protein